MGAIVSTTGEWDVVWPWPQVHFLQFYTLAFAPDGQNLKLYELEVINGSWNATEVMVVGDKDLVTDISVVDLGPFITLSVYNSADDTLLCWTRNPGIAPDQIGAYNSLPSINAPKYIAGCNYNGQVVIGGISTDDASWADLEFHSVAWSAIGQFNFRAQDKTSAGYAHTPWESNGRGRIWKLLKLGNSIIGYGNAGSVRLLPISSPVTGWSVNPLRVKLLTGNCVDGDETTHGFIDSDYEFWILSQEKSERLGFSEFIKPLFEASGVGRTDVLVRFEPLKKRFYISNGLKSYVVSAGALYECHQCVTSIGEIRKELAGFWYDLQNYEVKVTLNTFDFNQRGMKTLGHVEVGITSIETPEASAKWRSDRGNFIQSPWIPLNDSGVAYLGITATEFQISLRIDDYRSGNFFLDYIKPRLKLSDKRFVRGRYEID